MLNVDQFLTTRFPDFCHNKPNAARTLAKVLKVLFHEREFRQFETLYPHVEGFDFVDQVLEYFDFAYRVRDRERERIPARGRVVIIANHPIGSLDGLSLLKLIREIRSDVKVVANDMLTTLKPLHSLLLPVNNMDGNTRKADLQAITKHLENEGAVIIFPAGEVSRLSPKGVRDGRWQQGFLRFASTTQSPILPIMVDARNSLFFYALSFLAKPLSTLWLVREMFKHSENCVDIRIGDAIPPAAYQLPKLSRRETVKLVKEHLYRIGKGRKGLFATQTSIAQPENRAALRNEVRGCELLGETGDGKQIYLYRYDPNSLIIREIGRLREIAFRAVGEGSGTRRDTDSYDKHYLHLLLWDDADLEIAGAYRICPTNNFERNDSRLYSASLFTFTEAMTPYMAQGLELGRSFVQPRYWGRRSLDYLWYGIGAYLRKNPQCRYLFGPVTLSNAYPPHALQLLVHFYRRHFPAPEPLAIAKLPFQIPVKRLALLDQMLPGKDYSEEFCQLKSQLNHMDLSVPTLYKQYTELCEPGGVSFSGFNVDPEFANCVDGLIVVDLTMLKANKWNRYISSEKSGSEASGTPKTDD